MGQRQLVALMRVLVQNPAIFILDEATEGLAPLISHVRSLGMDFGIWVEPEMVNPDSDLHRAHPDWVLADPRYEPVLARHQLVLDLARHADHLGFTRYWVAEHHNMPNIASSAPDIMIGQIAAATQHLRVGSGGVMLPNHAPLQVAERYKVLEGLFPGRIDLGLGRAPGTDQRTWAALRRDIHASDRFPEDVVELQGYLAGASVVPGIRAIPGEGTRVPLVILGSSLFGAQLAARLGLPLLRTGFPLYDQAGAFARTWVGYRGSRQAVFDLANLLSGARREIAPYRSIYWQNTPRADEQPA